MVTWYSTYAVQFNSYSEDGNKNFIKNTK